MRVGDRRDHPRGRSTVIALTLFLALAAVGLLNHEMWRDEIEIWLIARDSSGPLELLENMATEGHPSVWYLLNFLAARFTDDPRAMQLLTLLLSAGAVWIFLRHAPFPLAVRLASVFGYFLLYEYTVISRNYVLVVLLGFAACAVLVRRGRLTWFSAALLFLLANTHLYGTIFAGLIGLLAVLHPRASGTRGADRTRVAGPAALVAAGALLGFGHTLLQSLAIGEAHAGAYRPGYDLAWVLSCLSTVTNGFLPVPDPTTAHTWNSRALDLLPDGPAAWIGALLGLGLLAGCAAILRKQRLVLAVFAAGAALLLGIVFFVWFGYVRHHGMLVVWFLLCAWLARGLDAGPTSDRPVPAPTSRALRAGVATVLAVQLAAGAFAWVQDLRRPFSNALAAGRYLARETDPGLRIVGSVDYAVQPIGAWSGRPFYYPESGRVGTFVEWSDRRTMVSPVQAVEAAADLLRDEERGELALVLNYPLPVQPGGVIELEHDVRLTHTAQFTGAIVPDENFHIFRLERRDGS